MGGSPPHMRGKEHVRLREQHGARITPAYAGKRRGFSYTQLHGKDHPRMCGEKVRPAMSPGHITGSPPHVRGKDSCTGKTPNGCRITPACAGKSYISGHHFCTLQDHPRMCGEKAGTVASIDAKVGSPPHVRGKEITFPRFLPSNGITPACAGKRESAENVGRAYVDHPRMCGEKD